MSADSPQIPAVFTANRIEAANKLASSSLFIRKRLLSLTLDAVAVGFISQAVFALTVLLAQKMSINLGDSAIVSFGSLALAAAFAFGAFDACTGCLIFLTLIVVALQIFASWTHYLIPLETFIVPIVVGAITSFLYSVLFVTFSSGTPGKFITKLVVTRANGARIGLFRAVLRHLTRGLSVLTIFAFPLLYPILCNRRQMIHDRIAETMVDVKDSILLQDKGLQAIEAGSAVKVPSVGRIAGIPRRIISAIIDSLIYYSIEGLAAVSAVLFIAMFVPIDSDWLSYFPDSLAGLAVLALVSLPFSILVPPVVMAAFESSALQATPGKIIMGMRVTTLSGAKCSFFQAIEKQFVQCFVYASLLPTGVVLLLLIAQLSQASWLIGCEVLAFYSIYGLILCWTLGSGQTLIDRWSKRYVVLDNSVHSDVLLLKESGAS